MSWVFLAGEEVYKLKKPVKTPVLDFSTLDARAVNTREEVRLNRCLAPDIYFGVVPLTLGASGQMAIGGRGEIVDWLVHMRRLPAEFMLDEVIERGLIKPEQIDTLGDRLSTFYRQARRPEITPEAHFAAFGRQQAENRSVLLRSEARLAPAEVERVLDRVEELLQYGRPLLEARVIEGRIVDGHGDLRPEHVCLLEPPVVIDRLEFNQKLRFVDPFDELSFLGMECGRLGAAWIGGRLINRCSSRLQDDPPESLIALYTATRALLRARLVLAHLLEPNIRTPEKWKPLARQYVQIANDASLRSPREVR